MTNSIRCAIGWHSWKSQYLRLPFKITVQSWVGPFDTKNHYQGERCKRCRVWQSPPKPAPLPRPASRSMRPEHLAQEQQKNQYMSALAAGKQSNAQRLGGLGYNQGCNCGRAWGVWP